MNFEAVLSRIASGESVPSSELLPYLCLEKREQRANVNRLLAEACLQSGREDQLRHARVFIHRAWLLSKFSAELLPLYTQIYSALDDVAGIREAYKRAGVEMAAQGNVSEAIRYFDSWQYADFHFKHLDRYEYDFDIMDCMDRLAQPRRLSPAPRAGRSAGEKIRVAYLVKGITEMGSVLVKINLLYARYHDRARVEPMFFVPESESAVLASASGPEFLRLFESHGCKVVMAPNVGDAGDRLFAVARAIYDARPDILVTSAALADFNHYFITSLRPAPFVVGFVQGPPPQFAPPILDWGIAWSKHPLIDCLVSCSHVEMEFDLIARSEVTPYERRELDIPEDALVAATAGRHVKFQEPKFWKAVIDLLQEHPQLYYLAVGAEESQVPFLPSMLSPELRSRIRFMGWRGDEYLRGICLVDIVIDTFPSGGGGTLCDSMALGVPVVAFENNYMKQYDQTDWSPAQEFIGLPERIVPRGDFDELKRVVSRMIDDAEYRRDVARRGQDYIWETRSHPERVVRNCEEAYFRLLENLSGNVSTNPHEAEIEELSRRLTRPQVVPNWVAWPVRQLKRALRFGERVLDRVA